MKSEKMMISLNGLAYASFMVVKEYEKINNESPSGLYFNKAISFLPELFHINTYFLIS